MSWLSFADTFSVLEKIESADDRRILIGGQALNLWCHEYRDRLPEIVREGVLTSKDVDFQGDTAEAQWCATRLGGQCYPDHKSATPPCDIVLFSDSSGVEQRLDFLPAVYGLKAEAVKASSIQVPFNKPSGGQLIIRVMNPVHCLMSRVHNVILEFAGHYHFAAKPVGIARGNEKGRVERKIRDPREAFFAARSFTSLADLNRQLDTWLNRIAHQRPVAGLADKRIVDALCEERTRLLPLPEHQAQIVSMRVVRSSKTPYVRFDGNDYSIPHQLVRRPLTRVASDTTVRLLDGQTEVARHARCWDKRQQIEDQAHLQGLASEKHNARDSRGRTESRHRP